MGSPDKSCYHAKQVHCIANAATLQRPGETWKKPSHTLTVTAVQLVLASTQNSKLASVVSGASDMRPTSVTSGHCARLSVLSLLSLLS